MNILKNIPLYGIENGQHWSKGKFGRIFENFQKCSKISIFQNIENRGIVYLTHRLVRKKHVFCI
jgi:hypothetical protein